MIEWFDQRSDHDRFRQDSTPRGDAASRNEPGGSEGLDQEDDAAQVSPRRAVCRRRGLRKPDGNALGLYHIGWRQEMRRHGTTHREGLERALRSQ